MKPLLVCAATFVLDPGVTGTRLAEHWKHVDTYWGTSLRDLNDQRAE